MTVAESNHCIRSEFENPLKVKSGHSTPLSTLIFEIFHFFPLLNYAFGQKGIFEVEINQSGIRDLIGCLLINLRYELDRIENLGKMIIYKMRMGLGEFSYSTPLSTLIFELFPLST